MARSSRFSLSQAQTDNMLKMLDSPQQEIRARGLLLIGQKEMIPLERLDQLYEAGDSEVRIAVLEYLMRNLPPGHNTFALKALTDSTNAVKIKALEYLIAFPNINAAPMLETLLEDQDFTRKDLVIQALETCNDGRAIDLLLPILKDAHHRYRMFASSTIGRIGGNPIIHELIPLLASEDEMTVFVATHGLANITDEQIIEPLLTVIDKWWSTMTSRIPDEVAKLLDKFHDARIRDTLLHLLTTKPSRSKAYGDMTRISAIHVLGNYSEPQVINYFTQLLQNGNLGDRYAVTYAFTKMKSPEALDVLMTYIAHETDASLLLNYSYAFAKIGDKRAVPILEDVLKRVDPRTQSSIRSNLMALNPPTTNDENKSLISKLKSRLKTISR